MLAVVLFVGLGSFPSSEQFRNNNLENLDPRKTGHKFILGLGTTAKDEHSLTFLVMGITISCHCSEKLGVEDKEPQLSHDHLSP